MVNNAQKESLVYRIRNQQYRVDDCLPQRAAVEAGKIGFHAWSGGHYPGTQIEEGLLPGISSVGFFDVTAAQDWGIPAHRNEGVEIVYQETGESVLSVDGVKHAMPTHCLTITRPWQQHSLGDPHLRAGRLHWLILDVNVRRPNQPWVLPDWCILTEQDQRELIEKLRGNESSVWKTSEEIRQIFMGLARWIRHEEITRAASPVRILINQLLAALLDLLRRENIVPDEDLVSMRRSVDLFFQELESDLEMLAFPWTLDDMARECGMGRTSFSDYCRELSNVTPMERLNRMRLAHAAERLRHERSTPITRIAMDVGYSTSQYFARRFRSQYGMSPREWRRSGLVGGQIALGPSETRGKIQIATTHSKA